MVGHAALLQTVAGSMTEDGVLEAVAGEGFLTVLLAGSVLDAV